MHRLASAWSFRLVTLTVVVMALGVGACGRKGPLDPPPGASTPAPEPAEVLKLGHAPDAAGSASRNG